MRGRPVRFVTYDAFETVAVLEQDGRRFAAAVAAARGDLAWLRRLHALLCRMAQTPIVVAKRRHLDRVIARAAAAREDALLIEWFGCATLPTGAFRLDDHVEIPDPPAWYERLREEIARPPADRLAAGWRQTMDDLRRLRDLCEPPAGRQTPRG